MADHDKTRFGLQAQRVDVPIAEAHATAFRIFKAHGCGTDEAQKVTDHLIEADRSGVEAHGIVRVLHYAREYEIGLLTPGATIDRAEDGANRLRFDANGGIGIRAMRAAVDAAADRAKVLGLAMATLRGAGHTG